MRRGEQSRGGFTLVELLLAIGIVGILAAIVLVAINPTKQLSDARTANRTASARELENAVIQYIIDGNSLAGIPVSKALAEDICRDTLSASACTTAGGYDLSFLAPEYLVNIPIDPDEANENYSGYRIYQIGSFMKICSPVSDGDCGT